MSKLNLGSLLVQLESDAKGVEAGSATAIDALQRVQDEGSKTTKLLKKALAAQELVAQTETVARALDKLDSGFGKLAATALETTSAMGRGFLQGGPVGAGFALAGVGLSSLIEKYSAAREAAERATATAAEGHRLAAQEAAEQRDRVEEIRVAMDLWERSRRSGRSEADEALDDEIEKWTSAVEDFAAKSRESQQPLAELRAQILEIDRVLSIGRGQQDWANAAKASQLAAQRKELQEQLRFHGSLAQMDRDGLEKAKARRDVLREQREQLEAQTRAAKAAADVQDSIASARARAGNLPADKALGLLGSQQFRVDLAGQLGNISTAEHERFSQSLADLRGELQQRLTAERSASEILRQRVEQERSIVAFFKDRSRMSAEDLVHGGLAPADAARLAERSLDAQYRALEQVAKDQGRDAFAAVKNAALEPFSDVTTWEGARAAIAGMGAEVDAIKAAGLGPALNAWVEDLRTYELAQQQERAAEAAAFLAESLEASANAARLQEEVWEGMTRGQRGWSKILGALDGQAADLGGNLFSSSFAMFLDGVWDQLASISWNVLSAAGEAVLGALSTLGSSIMQQVMLELEGMDEFQHIMTVVLDVAVMLAEALRPFVEALFPIVYLFQMLAEGIMPSLANIIEVFVNVMEAVWPVLKAAFQGISVVFATVAWALIGVYNFILRVVAGIVGIFSDKKAEAIRDMMIEQKSFGETIKDALAPFEDATWDSVNAQRRLADETERATAAMRNVPAGYKVALAHFEAIRAVETTPTLPPAIPHAAGGVVTRPTFALIGEAGPEAVVPLGRPSSGEGLDQVFGGGGVHIGQVTVVANNARELVHQLEELGRHRRVVAGGIDREHTPRWSGA